MKIVCARLLFASLLFLVIHPASAFNDNDFLTDLRHAKSMVAKDENAGIGYWEKLWVLYGGAPGGRYETELGTFYSNAARYDKAEKAYLDAIELDDPSPRPYVGLSFVHLEQGRFADAEKWAKRAVDEFPKHWIGYTTIGHVEWKQKRYASAQSWLKKSLNYQFRAATFWMLAIVSYELNDWQSTITSMDSATKLDASYRSDENGMRVAAIALAQLGRYGDAYEMVELLQSSNPRIKPGAIESLMKKVKELEASNHSAQGPS
jgi:tetratricopeptide (TPR) repeat protein